MRIFAGDVIPDLALTAPALPHPWVLPNGIGREHRNRLVRVLYSALRGGWPELRLGEIRWGERDLVARGRLRLPSPILIRWRIEPLPGVDRQAVMREAQRICTELSVFDFGQIAGDEVLAWLGPLKMEVLHRLIDALEEHPPVTPASQVGERLQELAELVRSPIDLIDGAEAMVEQIMLGRTVRSAYAEACARIIAARFDDEDRGRDAAEFIRALVQVAGKAEISNESRALLERVGLMEPGTAQPLPVAELLAADDVMPRAQRLIVAQFPLRQHIEELDLDVSMEPAQEWPFDPVEIRSMTSHLAIPEPVARSPRNAATEELLEGEQPRTPGLRTAARRLAENDLEGAAKPLLDELASGRSQSWSPETARAAANMLFQAAEQLGKRHPGQSPRLAVASAWFEASAEFFLLADDQEGAAIAYFRAGERSLEFGNAVRAEALLERSLAVAEPLDDKAFFAFILLALGQAKRHLARMDEAKHAYHYAWQLSCDIPNVRGQAIAALRLGTLAFAEGTETNNRDTCARHWLDKAYALAQELDDEQAMGTALFLLGALDLKALNRDDAEDKMTQALRYRLPPKQEARARVFLGMRRLSRDDWAEARNELEQACILFREQGDISQYTVVLNMLGTMYLQLHEMASARSMFESALAASAARDISAERASALTGMGHVLRWLGDIESARRSYEQARDLAQSSQDPGKEADALRALGTLALWRGDLHDSQTLYEQAVALKRQTPSPVSAFEPLCGLAGVLIARGEDAQEYIEECSQLAETADLPYDRERSRLLEAALSWPTAPDSAKSTWDEVAAYFRQSRRKAQAALAGALSQVAGGRDLDQVAQDLEDALGTVHPLPDRVRRAGSPDEAIRAIIPFAAN